MSDKPVDAIKQPFAELKLSDKKVSMKNNNNITKPKMKKLRVVTTSKTVDIELPAVVESDDELELASSSGDGYEIGKLVKIKELVKNDHYNGCVGVIKGKLNEKGFYPVMTANKVLALKPENIERDGQWFCNMCDNEILEGPRYD